jgi:photosystem II stability/assembly factor-like uncharacterized protein
MGGVNWTSIQLPREGEFDSLFSVMDIKFINSNIGYVLGFFQLECKIWKTTNGGSTWATQTTGGANYLNTLYFIDENTGFSAGGSLNGEAVKTTNGGATWQLVYQESPAVYSIKFITPLKGFLGCEEGRVYKTSDGGNTWTFALSDTGLDILSLNFTDANTGFGFGTGSVCTKTTDGGNNWYEYPMGIPMGSQYFDAVATPNGNLIAAGSYGSMVRSTNGGVSFITPPNVTNEYISDMEFVNSSTGYAVAGYSGGDILKTTNSGETWVSQITQYTTPIYGIAASTDQIVHLAGSIDLLKTTNGGTNWVKTYSSTTNEIFTDIFFTNDNTGYAVGSYGRQMKTTNAGLNWVATTISSSGTMLSSIYFTDDNTGYAVGDNSSAVKTTNAGVTWIAMSVGSGFITHNNVTFTDANTGYIASTAGIYKTINAGSNWNLLSAPVGGYSKVQFRGSFGYAIGGGGKIIKSINSGSTWLVQPTVTSNSLYALYFNTDNFVYAGGILGTMIKTLPTEFIPTSVHTLTNEVADGFSLSQNYPNPFNPSTSIKFSMTKAEFVTLKIYDIKGREVAELVNSNLQKGNYSINWNASQFSSGVYFYKLESSSFTSTKKMMLVK